MTTVADLDRRKALIVACLYPTRVRRGFKTHDDCQRLGAQLGVSQSTIRAWEEGDILPSDKRVSAIEHWLASGPVWRYDRIDHVVGPETWPKPLEMPAYVHRKARKSRLHVGLGTNSVSQMVTQLGPTQNAPGYETSREL